MTYIGYKADGVQQGAHMTVMWLGRLDKDRLDYVKYWVNEFEGSPFIVVERGEIDLFTKGLDPVSNESIGTVPVLLVKPPEEYYTLLRYLARQGIESASECNMRPYMRPHITLNLDPKLKQTIKLPRRITLYGLGVY